MKKISCVLIALATVLLFSGCSGQIELFNNALDSDRNSREKMASALNLMLESDSLLEEATEESLEKAEQKRAEAKDAYIAAIESWEEADRYYQDLIDKYPNDADYPNNWGNSLYFRAFCGLDSDLEKARELLNAAAKIEDRPITARNLELIEELESNSETKALVLLNRDLVAKLEMLME